MREKDYDSTFILHCHHCNAQQQTNSKTANGSYEWVLLNNKQIWNSGFFGLQTIYQSV